LSCKPSILVFTTKNYNYRKASPNLAEADPGGLDASPQSSLVNSSLLFPEKEAKSDSSASQKTVHSPKLGEADPGGLGASPQSSLVNSFLLFPEKEAKSVSSASQKSWLIYNYTDLIYFHNAQSRLI
jgi:hypothetical protein